MNEPTRSESDIIRLRQQINAIRDIERVGVLATQTEVLESPAPSGSWLPHAQTFQQPDEGRSEIMLNSVVSLLVSADPAANRQASQIATAALQQDSSFDKKLCKVIRKGGLASPDQAIRILRLLEGICTKSSLLEHLLNLRGLDGRVRSKVTMTIGRLVQNSEWLHGQLADANPRIRANAVEALWHSQADGVEAMLWEATQDTHSRVVANAALGLYKMGNVGCVPVFYYLLRHSQEIFRRSGLWAVSMTNDIRYLEAVEAKLNTNTEEERVLAKRAAEHLLQVQATLRFMEKLQVHVTQVRASGNGRRSATVWCGSPSLDKWLDASHLKAVDFTIIENGKQMEIFHLQWTKPQGPLTAAILLPALWSRSGQMLRTIWKECTANEKLSLIPYLTETFYSRDHLDEQLAIKLDSNVNIAMEQFETEETRAVKNLERALTMTLEELDQLSGWRHVFIVVDPSQRLALTPVLDMLVQQTQIKVHVVVPQEVDDEVAQSFQQLSQLSGGTFAKADGIDTLRQMIASVRGSHHGSCELSWNSTEATVSELQIKCCSSLGYGEAVRT